MKKTALVVMICLASVGTLAAQRARSKAASGASLNDLVRISKAEDSLNFSSLADFLKSPNAGVRARAALAAGRIGDEGAVGALIALLTDADVDVQRHAMFAIGEIESIKPADTLIGLMKAETRPVGSAPMRAAKLLEAAGKIAAANVADPKSKTLGAAILETLEREHAKTNDQDRETIRLGLTAALRARPDKADATLAKFLTHTDARIRADAANALSRLRAKNANSTLREMLKSDRDPVVRANAARALGAAEDKEAVRILLDAAIADADLRVRVSALRPLATLGDAKSADRLLVHGSRLLASYKASKLRNPAEKSELIEIAIVLGRLRSGTRDAGSASFLKELAILDNGRSPEFSIARLRVSPGRFGEGDTKPQLNNWHQYVTLAQLIGEFATLKLDTDEAKKMAQEAPSMAKLIIDAYIADDKSRVPNPEGKVLAAPDFLRAYARFKTPELAGVLINSLKHSEVDVRATAAGLLADLPSKPEHGTALKSAFTQSISGDKQYNDAQLATLDALFKIDKKGSVDMFTLALGSPDHLVRKKGLELLNDSEIKSDSRVIAAVAAARAARKDQILPYNPATGTKLGQVLNTDADYRRALSRRNGSVRAVLTTEKGAFTIDFYPEEAPLTVDNFVKLARSGYFDGLEVHRVVPNFVMQDGDPRGDGNGGPGWSIRCEVNMREYGRGAVGMALSGKDTGGSQWFVTHTPQPHLDGGYTVFGQVSERDMRVVDSIVRGDRILSVKIGETLSLRGPSKRAGK